MKSLYTESVSFPPCLGFGFAVFCLRLSLLSLTALVERRLVVFFDILMKLFRWCVGTTSVGTTSVGIVVSFYIITFPGLPRSRASVVLASLIKLRGQRGSWCFSGD